MSRLLVVDDEPSICWAVSRLGTRVGYDAVTAASAEEGWTLADQQPFDAVVLDVRLPGIDGLSAISGFRSRLGPVPIVIVTAYGDLPTAVSAVQAGAFDYLLKPFDLAALERTIRRALASSRHQVAEPTEALQGDVNSQTLVGDSPAMQQVFKQIALAAGSDACVHIHGESGTGKELIARAIHRFSRRAKGPLVVANLASLSESLAESELFGHVRGAFTGAVETRCGLLEQADGGSIFLDEVADIPPALQVKLLRAVEYGEVLPVGATQPRMVDFRVITATHRDLQQCVAAGQFRHDLYYRLNTFQIHVPPLRQRREDLPQLVRHFTRMFAARGGTPVVSVPEETLEELARRPWYGNIRELRNAIEFATIHARGGVLLPEHLPPPTELPPSDDASTAAITAALRQWARAQWSGNEEPSDVYQRLLDLVEPPVLEEALAQHQGQFASAARSLGLHRITVRKKVAEHRRTRGIEPGDS